MGDPVRKEAAELARAARYFITDRAPGVTSQGVADIVSKWSVEGWQAVARDRGLAWVPTRYTMQKALEILTNG
jgi:hypothetical protein